MFLIDFGFKRFYYISLLSFLVSEIMLKAVLPLLKLPGEELKSPPTLLSFFTYGRNRYEVELGFLKKRFERVKLFLILL
jgi:hypothetical protein